MNGFSWGELVQQIAPTTGALILSALLLFLLRIPQSSRVVAETYDAIIKQLREQNKQQQMEMLQLEEDMLTLRTQHIRDITVLREESRRALEQSEQRCEERLAELERLVKRLDLR